MKLALLFSFFFYANAITQEQANTLIRWQLCPFPTIAADDCSWLRRCMGTDCIDNVVTSMTFNINVYGTLNETERLLFSEFPNVSTLVVTGGGGAVVSLYPEIGILTQLQAITIHPRVTGTIPNEWESLLSLSSLVLSNAVLSGTIPQGFSDFPMKRFEIAGLVGSNLEGPIPNFLNATSCQVSRVFSGGIPDNPGLFCACNNSCSASGGYNYCSAPCGTITTASCDEAVATLGYGYVCVDACRRCGAECLLNADRTAYRCPNDPIPPPPSTSESSRTTPTLDGDDRSSNPAVTESLF
jgi:hypothetical protein